MSKELTAQQTNSDFFKTLASLQKNGEAPKPVYVRLNGKTGVWNETVFNEVEKKNDNTPFLGGGDWMGAILLVKWFSKSKYKEGATKVRRTREFSDFKTDAIEYLEIDYKDKENGTKVLGNYGSYAEFKEAMQAEYGKAVNEAIANKQNIPKQDDFIPDLFGSIYVYNFELNRVINIKVKGKSRSALFDYLSGWRRGLTEDDNADSISQVLTSFGMTEFDSKTPVMKDGKPTDELEKFYAAKFKADSVLSGDYQSKVKEAILATFAWMKSFSEDDEEVQAVHVDQPANNDGQEIRLEDIPF